MTADVGAFAVIAGLVACVLACLTIVVGLVQGRPELLRLSGRWAAWTFAFAATAAVAMEVALLSDDFSLEYVAGNSISTLPLLYKVSVLWAALEGSLLLWVLVLTGYIAAVAWKFRTRLDDRLLGFAMLTMFVVAGFFFFLLAGPGDPFSTLRVAPADGTGPNPLLQNHPLMAIHPVMLYLGYVGFTVPFAFGIGALATGRLGEGWLIETRPWTMVAWGCLTVGIVLGAWWSYEVLGWGGYWAWDPVENVSFLPWITASAFIHSVVVQERRGMLRVWNLSLLTSTFGLTILGTFVTRSGVLDSVHEFSESSIGPMLLGLFTAIVVVSVGLIGWRVDELRSVGAIESPLSREGSFLANNLLFAGFAFVVLLGTMFPLLIEALNGDQLAVGSPYFDRLSQPIGLALLFVMGVSPLLPWRATSPELLSERALWPAVVGVLTLIVAVAVGAHGLGEMFGFLLAGSVIGSAGRHLVMATRRQGWRGATGRTGGGMVAHVGLAVLALGFVASQGHSTEAEARMIPGDVLDVGDHRVEFIEISRRLDGPREVTEVALLVDGDEIHKPAITLFPNFGRPIGTPSVATGWQDDVYLVVLDVDDEANTALVRVIIRPLIAWIWTGGLMMGLGTVLALIPAVRRRDETDVSEEDSPAAPPSEDPVLVEAGS